MNIQTVKNVSDCQPLYLPHSLYLKPHAKMALSVQMPTAVTGKAISNWDVMENLRSMIAPDKFSVLKATKSTLELIRFDAELEERERLKAVITRLDGNSIKLSGFSESARIRASEAKDNFPRRHDWDSYFRDARNMDEKKPGERPDTIHISNLPIRWFCPRHMENEDGVKPSESIFKRIFEKFGSVRVVDIPICDLYRKEMKSHMTGMKTFSFDQELYFEGYVQFSEYIGFVRTMDALRGMKLLRKEGDKNLAISIAVDFDTTKHLCESNIKRRQIIRDRLIMKENEKREEERRKTEEEEKKKDKERQRLEQIKIDEYEKQHQREEKRKEKYLKKLREQEQQQLSSKIRTEEKKLLIAQRKLESIRVLEALFDRIKLKNETLKMKIKKEFESNKAKHNVSGSGSHKEKKFDLRNKLISKVKSATEQELERQKNRLKKFKAGAVKANERDVSKERSPSVNSISSDDSVLSDKPSQKKKKRRDERSRSVDDDEHMDKVDDGHVPIMPGMGAYPMYHPETGQWLGMYPYPPPFFPPIYPHSGMPYNNYRGAPNSNYRGRFPRSRGRGSYRGGRYSSYDDRRNDDSYDSYDHKRRRRRRSNSRSSRSSRSYSSRSRSSSYPRNRRNRRSSSKQKSKLQEEHKSKKLASTLRRSHSSAASSSRSRRSHSRPSRKRSRSHHNRNRHSAGRDNRKSRSRDKRSRSKSKTKRDKSQTSNVSKGKRRTSRSLSQTEKIPESHTPVSKNSPRLKRATKSKSSSKSIDSSTFQSPKRKAPSVTPEKEWD